MCCSQIKPSAPWSCNNAPETPSRPVLALICTQRPCLMKSPCDWNGVAVPGTRPSDDTSVQQIVPCAVFDMRSQVELLMVLVYCFRGEMIIQGKEDLKERVESLDRFNINKSCQNNFFPLRSNFYPLSGGLILQACDKVFWQSIPAVAVISSLCWSLCLSKDGTNAATPNPTSWSAAQSVVSYYTVIQTSHRIWMWLIFSGKLFVSGWLLAAAGYTSSSSSPPATGLHSSSLWLSHYSSIKV